MNLKIWMIGVATLGLLAPIGVTRAMPAAPLGTAATQSSDIVKAHYSRHRHTHKRGHIVWLSGPRAIAATEGTITTGRSVTKHQRSKSLQKKEQMAPTGGTQGRSVQSPPSGSQPSGAAPGGGSSQGPQKGGSQKGGGSSY